MTAYWIDSLDDSNEGNFVVSIKLLSDLDTMERTLEVRQECKLFDLHCMIQAMLNWGNYHLHQFSFRKDETTYIFHNIFTMDDTEIWGNTRFLGHEKDVTLKEAISYSKELLYEYDLGDGWELSIKLEKTLPGLPYPEPRLIAGCGQQPIEDCGGNGGFHDLVQIMDEDVSIQKRRKLAKELYGMTLTEVEDWAIGNGYFPFSLSLARQALKHWRIYQGLC